MTREEEIKQASEIIRGNQYGPTLARQGFVEGARWADAHPHWISVEDGLPEKGEMVLLALKGYEWVDIGYYDGIQYRDDEGDKFDGLVTHFMRFPKLPEGGE
jgi:hypothetical protein